MGKGVYLKRKFSKILKEVSNRVMFYSESTLFRDFAIAGTLLGRRGTVDSTKYWQNSRARRFTCWVSATYADTTQR